MEFECTYMQPEWIQLLTPVQWSWTLKSDDLFNLRGQRSSPTPNIHWPIKAEQSYFLFTRVSPSYSFKADLNIFVILLCRNSHFAFIAFHFVSFIVVNICRWQHISGFFSHIFLIQM